jgi:hypothetical protein
MVSGNSTMCGIMYAFHRFYFSPSIGYAYTVVASADSEEKAITKMRYHLFSPPKFTITDRMTAAITHIERARRRYA